jgi:NAD(P)-dependent dehydrogenase (short-subunit alcohol dehydrogenase family)
MSDLAGKGVLVTGAARGIGRAICERMCAEGAYVIMCDVVDAALDQAVDAMPVGTATSLHADVRDTAAIASWLDEHDAWPDVLVNNAAIAPRTRIAELDADLLADTFAVNATAGIMLAQRVGGRLIESGSKGSIVNVASVNAYRGHAELLHYNASKAAMLSATRTLAAAWGQHGVRVNAVCPGSTWTDIWQEGGFSQADRDDYASRNPMRRFAQPLEIAEAVLFMASDRASFVTGAELVADGGLLVNIA